MSKDDANSLKDTITLGNETIDKADEVIHDYNNEISAEALCLGLYFLGIACLILMCFSYINVVTLSIPIVLLGFTAFGCIIKLLDIIKKKKEIIDSKKYVNAITSWLSFMEEARNKKEDENGEDS